MEKVIGSFEQLYASQPNALEQLRVLTQTPEGNKHLQNLYLNGLLYCLIRLSPFDMSNLEPNNSEDFVAYFSKTLWGVEYAQNKWGEIAIPSKFFVGLNLSHPTLGLIQQHIGYNKDEDEFAITIPHIFEGIRGYKGRALSLSSQLPQGILVTPEDFATLQGIEECYHRFQAHALGREFQPFEDIMKNPHYHEEDMNELEIRGVWEEAIQDLNIKTYLLLS